TTHFRLLSTIFPLALEQKLDCSQTRDEYVPTRALLPGRVHARRTPCPAGAALPLRRGGAPARPRGLEENLSRLPHREWSRAGPQPWWRRPCASSWWPAKKTTWARRRRS